MEISNKSFFRNFGSIVIAILIMFTSIATMGIIFLKTTLINENTYKKAFEKANTYEHIYESINDNVKYMLTLNGIPREVLDDIISKEEIVDVVESTTESFISFINGGSKDVIEHDFSVYEKRVDDKLNKFIRDNNMYLNESQTNDLNIMKDNIKNIIDSELQIINFSELSKSRPMIIVSSIVGKLSSNLVLVAMVVLNIALMMLFFAIWKRRRARAYAWVGYSLISGGLILFLLSFSGYLSGFYNYVIIAIEYIASTVAIIIETYLIHMSVISFVVVILGILSLSVYWKHLYRRYSNKDLIKSENC